MSSYGSEPARTTTPQNVSDDVLTAGELQSRFEHKNEPEPAPKKRLPNPAVKVEFFSIPAPVHEENLSPYGQRKPMRATIRERLVAAIDVARLEHRHCVLVVDQVAACAIAKVLSVRDLRRLGVRRVHQLEQDRPFGRGSHMHAIYMVSPSFRALGNSEEASMSTEFSRKFAATVRKASTSLWWHMLADCLFTADAYCSPCGVVWCGVVWCGVCVCVFVFVRACEW